ncbi:hypothetical protein [Herbaspirillum rubrisubalbicans]|uniref:hypothetical protein n=1 Tax=Herbaspirillum rubrisubalbicans TaxID=80842 RepID=UPI00037BAC6F|nr:hypothetical protein [Herbaspirillum rubrisubalbicans]
MAKNQNVQVLSVADAQQIIAEAKTTVRLMEWIPKKTKSNLQWIEFVSACSIQSEIREDVMFRAQYRAGRTIAAGESRIETAEIFNASLCVGPFRILALDSADTPHKNKVGTGYPLHLHSITSRTHKHIWTPEGYGYAEPVEPALDDIESLINAFLPMANLTLLGGFNHPLRGNQMELL